jgi:hypothetical protein
MFALANLGESAYHCSLLVTIIRSERNKIVSQGMPISQALYIPVLLLLTQKL